MPGRPLLRLIRPVIALILLLPLAAMAISSGGQRGIHLSLELLSEQTALTPGGEHWLALRIEHDPHWHTYWRNPGDSGLPTRINWQLPDEFSAGPIHWPFPQRLPFGPLINFGFEGEAWLLTPIQVPAHADTSGSVTLQADVSYLVCKEECIPGSATLAIELPVRGSSAAVTEHAAGFQQARQRLPQLRTDWTGTLAVAEDGLQLRLIGDLPARFELFPVAEDIFGSQPFTGWQPVDGALVGSGRASDWFAGLPATVPMLLIDLDAEPVRAFQFELTADDDVATSAPAQSTALPSAGGGAAGSTDAPGSGTSSMSLFAALALALAGGVILNLMPCVFPVLSMKALALVQTGADQRRARREGLFYTAGVLASFGLIGGLLLALRAGGEQVGWGFQLQSPWLVMSLAYLMFLLGLGLSGIATLGTGWMNVGQQL
ncbi:MAG: protein-disulfide reductase DsbD domain-containing protein, partial [Lysobacterales bacterium]